MTPAEVACRMAFGLADAEGVTLWREGSRVRYRAAGTLSAALAGILSAHRPTVLFRLSLYPGGRREPGADSDGWTARAETLLAELPEPLREHERGRWCADLARRWAQGESGRDAAQGAFDELERRTAGKTRPDESGPNWARFCERSGNGSVSCVCPFHKPPGGRGCCSTSPPAGELNTGINRRQDDDDDNGFHANRG